MCKLNLESSQVLRAINFYEILIVKGKEKFGPWYLYKLWKKACDDHGIEGVDLYGSTRHSTSLTLRKATPPEQIKRATMHSTNKAFERYFKVEGEEVRSVYELASKL